MSACTPCQNLYTVKYNHVRPCAYKSGSAMTASKPNFTGIGSSFYTRLIA